MNRLVKFFHELKNPHCPHCADLRDVEFERNRENARCNSCESLQLQLASLQEQNKFLIEKLASPVNEPMPTRIVDEKPRVLQRGPIPFSTIRTHLETEARTRLNAMKNAAQPDSSANVTQESVSNKDNLTDLEDKVLNAGIKAEATGTKQA